MINIEQIEAIIAKNLTITDQRLMDELEILSYAPGELDPGPRALEVLQENLRSSYEQA